jgi:hypothetical protein
VHTTSDLGGQWSCLPTDLVPFPLMKGLGILGIHSIELELKNDHDGGEQDSVESPGFGVGCQVIDRL